MKICIYCGKQADSQEHTLSEGVAVEFFKQMPKIRRASSSMGTKYVKSLETIGDVCIHCNGMLSTYDAAGIVLVKEITNMLRPRGLMINFNSNTFGWLIKTSCNYARTHPSNGQSINPEIYNKLINYSEINDSFVRMRILGLDCNNTNPFLVKSDSDTTLPLQFSYLFNISELNIFRVLFFLRNIMFELSIRGNIDEGKFINNVNMLYREYPDYFDTEFQHISITNALDRGYIRFHNVLPIENCTRYGSNDEFFKYMDEIKK
jgi:hypothetical protein